MTAALSHACGTAAEHTPTHAQLLRLRASNVFFWAAQARCCLRTSHTFIFLLLCVCAAVAVQCRACSLCKPCTSTVPDDLSWEACEPWCSVHDHCSSCKCRACSFCRACTPLDESDTEYEDAQPWCTDKAHCEYARRRPRAREHAPPSRGQGSCPLAAVRCCKTIHPVVARARACASPSHRYCKCKASPRCQSLCTPHDGNDDDFTSCQGWCKHEAYHCPFCKCKNCDLCREKCMPWCQSEGDWCARRCHRLYRLGRPRR